MDDLLEFRTNLKSYVLKRLDLPLDVHEDDIRRLVILSVKWKNESEGSVFIESRLAGSDCHQTTYVVQKKTLLMMEIEKRLGVKLTSEDVDHVETVTDYALVLWEAMNAC